MKIWEKDEKNKQTNKELNKIFVRSKPGGILKEDRDVIKRILELLKLFKKIYANSLIMELL